MKLHLPIGLRKALMAVLAVLPTASFVVSASSMVAVAAEVDPVQQLIDAYNATAAEGAKIWLSDNYICGTANQEITINNYDSTDSVTLGHVTGLADALIKENEVLGSLASLVQPYLDQTSYYLFDSGIGVNQETISDRTFKGTLTSSALTSATQIINETQTDANGTKELNKVLMETGVLDGSSYFLTVSGIKDITCKDTYTGTVTGTVDVNYSYYDYQECTVHEWWEHYKGNCNSSITDIDGTLDNQEFKFEGETYTYDHVITTGVQTATITKGKVDYVLKGGENIDYTGDITMAEGKVANSFTIGSDTKASLHAIGGKIEFVADEFIVVQGASTLTADTSLYLNGGSVSVLDKSGLTAQEVIVNADGSVSFVGGSGVNAGTMNVQGGTISLSGAKFITTGQAAAPNLTDDDAKALDVVDADMKLHAEGALTIDGNTNISANLVDVNSASGVVTVTSSSIRGTHGVNMEGSTLALTGATVMGSDVEMNATGDIKIASGSDIRTLDDHNYSTSETITLTSTGGSISVTGANVGLNAKSEGTKKPDKVIMEGTAISVEDSLIKGASVELTATSGDVKVVGETTINEAVMADVSGKNVYITGNNDGSRKNARIGSRNIKLTASEAIVLSQMGGLTSTGFSKGDPYQIILDAGTSIKLESGASISAEDASVDLIAGDSVLLTGNKTKIESANHDISLNGFYTNEINGATVEAGGDVKMTSGQLVLEFSSDTVSNLKGISFNSNTVSGANISADGAFTMTGLKWKIEEKDEDGKPVLDENDETIGKIYTVGLNNITDGSTVNAGSVKLDGLLNTVSGKYATLSDKDGENEAEILEKGTLVTATGNIELGAAGMTLFNTVKGANVTSTGGDIVLTGQLNTVEKDATLTSKAGSILLNGSSAVGVQELMGTEIKIPVIDVTIGTLGDVLSKILPEGTTFDYTLNNVNGNLDAKKNITLNATANLLGGGNVQAGKKVELSGLVNAVTGSVSEGEDGVLTSTTNVSGKHGVVIGDNAETLINIVNGAYVNAGLNKMTSDRVSDALTLNGQFNYVGGDSHLVSESGSLTLAGSAMQGDNGLAGMLELLLQYTGDSSSELVDTLVKYGLITENEDENGNVTYEVELGNTTANIVAGSGTQLEATQGAVNLKGATANLLLEGDVKAGSGVNMEGAINAVVGSDVVANGGNINLTGTAGNNSIASLIQSLMASNNNFGLDEKTMAVIQPLLESLSGSANAMIGGSLDAQKGSVALSAAANLMTGGEIKAEKAVTFDGAINAVTGGSITGGSVDFFASENNLQGLANVVGSLSGLLEGEDQAKWAGIIAELGAKLKGNTNLVIGGEVKATSGNVTMDGSLNVLAGEDTVVSAEKGAVQLTGMANVLAGATVENTMAAELSGAINAVLSGKLEGGSITLNGSEEGLNLGEVLVPVLEAAGVDSSITGLVGELGTIDGNINLVTGGTVNATSGNATLNGTLNLLTGGSVSANTTATLNGAANVLMGGTLSGANVVMQQGATGINLGGVIKPLLESAGVGAEITDLVGNLGEINGNINVVTGNAVVNGTNTVKMDSLANVVVGEDAEVTGGKITMTGTQSIDLPLGTIVNGLVSQYVELPDAVVDVLGSLDGEIGLNTNVVTNGGTVSATEQAKLNASVNYVGNGGSVSGDTLVELTGPMNLVLSNGSLTSENGTVRLNGYGPSLNQMGVQIPAEYAGYVEQLGLSGLLNKQFGVNVVMGEGAEVSGKGIELNSGLMNLVADGAVLEAGNGMSLSSAANVVLNGAELSAADGTLSMSGSLNLVSSLGFNDFVNAVQNGTALPVDGALTTLSGQNVQLWGAANVVHGNVHVTATGDVVMAGMGEPLFELSTMTVQQVVDLARELGVPALLDDAKSEVLNALMDYAAENNMSDLVEAAAALGLQDQLSGIYSDLKDFVKENGDAALNLSLNGNVNTVSGGAMVNGNGVYMNGTINYVGDLASVTGNTVKIDGITNVVAGGAEVTGGDVTLSGGANVLVATTLDNVKDAIANGSLGSLVAGGKDQTTVSGNNVTLDAKANLMYGKVAVTADNTVTMQGITNVVAGGATVSGKGSVNMDAVANVLAGGANVNAGFVDENGNVVQGDINMTGGLNAVVDTTLGNVVDALQQQSLAPLMQGGSAQTTLTATGDINLGAALNVVNGGKVVLTAGEAVNMTGAVNVFSGNTKVNATDINMTGMEVPELDLSGILPAEYNDLANEIVEEGLNLNVVAGGAKLTATNDITLSGVASAVVDTSMTNVLDALKQQSIDPLLKGGNIETVLTAGNDINLISKLNVVNGGKVTLTAGNDVTMAGVLNVVNGNNVVTAGNAINMDAAANLVSGGAYLKANTVSIGGNAALSDEFAALIESVIPGVELPSGVSAGVVMGNGTSVNASNRVEMLSNVNVVADSAKINAETATARMAGTLNAVTTDAAVSADKVDMLGTVGNLVLDGATVAAKGNATMTGAANVVQGATVTTTETGNINMEALGAVSNGLSEVVDKLLPDSATAERVNNLLAQGNANAVVDGAQLNAAGNVSMKAAANVVDNATVSAGGNVAMSSSVLHTINNSTIQSVSGNVSISGGIATVTGSTVTAEQGRINFSDVNIAMSGGSMYAADGMTVANGAYADLSNVTLGGESVIELGSSLNISNLESIGDIENFGSLSLENAVLSGATLYNAGSVMVSNKLTLDSATLSFVADSLTMNSTAIVLGDGFDTIIDGPGAGDMLAGLSFALNYDALEFRKGSDSVFDFKLAIFEGITADQTSLLAAALQDGEFSITLSNGFLVDVNEDLSIVWENNVAYVTGSASVPEPTTATLSLLALAALAARRRRK